MEHTLLTTVVVLLFLILVSLWLVLYQLVKQQGRMLLRLDGLEGRPHVGLQDAAHDGGKRRLPGERPLSESRIEREGLKVGTPAPPFSLPDIRGRLTTLEEFRGRRVLLVFTDPHCAPCDQLAPALVRLHEQNRDKGLAVVMVGRGEPEENRRKAEQHRIEFPLVIQRHWELSKAYGIFATPAAFLIDERGIIARNVGKGADDILALAL